MRRLLSAFLLLSGAALAQPPGYGPGPTPVTGTPGNITSFCANGVACDSGTALANVPQINLPNAWAGMATFNGGIELGLGTNIYNAMNVIYDFNQPNTNTYAHNWTCNVNIVGSVSGAFPCMESTLIWTGSGSIISGGHAVAMKPLISFEGTGTVDHGNSSQASVEVTSTGTLTTANLYLGYVQTVAAGGTIGTLNTLSCPTPNPVGTINSIACIYQPPLSVTNGGTIGSARYLVLNQEPSMPIDTAGHIILRNSSLDGYPDLQFTVGLNGGVTFESGRSTSIGNNSVDLQIVTNAGTQIASGQYAFSAGSYNTASGGQSAALGQSNSTSGTGSFAAGLGNPVSGTAASALGQQNSIDGSYSTAPGGYLCRDNGQYSVMVWCSGDLVGQGDAKRSWRVVRGIVVNTGTTVLTQDGGALGLKNSFNFQANSSARLSGKLICNASGAATKEWTVDALARQAAGPATTVLVGSTVTSAFGDSSLAGVTVAVAVDTTGTTNGAFTVSVTGVASTTLHCEMAADLAEII